MNRRVENTSSKAEFYGALIHLFAGMVYKTSETAIVK